MSSVGCCEIEFLSRQKAKGKIKAKSSYKAKKEKKKHDSNIR